MDISYDIIIKYLSKNNNEKINFSNKKHIISYIDKFPEKFSNLLQNKFYKYGITILNKNNVNISFYTSLLTLLNNKFLTFTFDEELEYLKRFKLDIKDNIDSYIFSNYFENWLIKDKICKKDIIDNTKYCIQLLSEIFDINILILDFKNKNIKIAYADEKCNPWKPIILLSNYEELWEPVMYDSKRTFTYNDIKKLLCDGNIKYYEENLINKPYILNENIKIIIDDIQKNIQILDNIPIIDNIQILETNNVQILETNNVQIIETNNVQIIDNVPTLETNNVSDTFIKTEESNTTNNLTKKNKNELIEICKTKNIKVTTKMLKKDIIELILNN
jgi:hypothetical protein